MKELVGSTFTFKDGRTVPFTPAVKCSGLIFVSGQIAMDKNNEVVGDTIGEQTHQVIKRISDILESCGATLADVVKTTVWITDSKNFADFNEEYAKHFGASPPARSTTCASLMLPGYLVEIEAIAADPRADKS
jgi:2-iminobutanoate/2-iminopropanoate deaminase